MFFTLEVAKLLLAILTRLGLRIHCLNGLVWNDGQTKQTVYNISTPWLLIYILATGWYFCLHIWRTFLTQHPLGRQNILGKHPYTTQQLEYWPAHIFEVWFIQGLLLCLAHLHFEIEKCRFLKKFKILQISDQSGDLIKTKSSLFYWALPYRNMKFLKHLVTIWRNWRLLLFLVLFYPIREKLKSAYNLFILAAQNFILPIGKHFIKIWIT